MELKKAVYGGYEKESVDELIRQYSDNEANLREHIRILENENQLLKENSQKKYDELSSTLSARENELEELKSRQFSNVANTSPIAENVVDRKKISEKYEEQVKKIGLLHVNAQTFIEKIKNESKIKTIEEIEKVFEEIYTTKKEFDDAVSIIIQKKKHLLEVVSDLNETLQSIQTKIDKIGIEQTDFESPFEKISKIKEEIKNQIDDDYIQSTKSDESSFVYEPQEEVEEPVMKQPDENVGISEAREATEDKEIQEILEFLGSPEPDEEPVSYVNDEYKEFIEQTKPVAEKIQENPEETKQLTEHDYYEKYFSEISKKYSKDQQTEGSKSFLDSYMQGGIGSSRDSFSSRVFETKPTEGEETTPPLSDASSGQTEPLAAENEVAAKKPSIKDILNKYSSMN